MGPIYACCMYASQCLCIHSRGLHNTQTYSSSTCFLNIKLTMRVNALWNRYRPFNFEININSIYVCMRIYNDSRKTFSGHLIIDKWYVQPMYNLCSSRWGSISRAVIINFWERFVADDVFCISIDRSKYMQLSTCIKWRNNIIISFDVRFNMRVHKIVCRLICWINNYSRHSLALTARAAHHLYVYTQKAAGVTFDWASLSLNYFFTIQILTEESHKHLILFSIYSISHPISNSPCTISNYKIFSIYIWFLYVRIKHKQLMKLRKKNHRFIDIVRADFLVHFWTKCVRTYLCEYYAAARDFVISIM